MVSTKFQRDFRQPSRQRSRNAVCCPAPIQTPKPDPGNGARKMQERPVVEAMPRQTRPARPRLLLSWRLDPVTGRPAAQWTVEQPKTISNIKFQAAA